MKINTTIQGVIITAIFGLQAWTLTEVVNLKTSVAVITQRLDDQEKQNEKANHIRAVSDSGSVSNHVSHVASLP